MEPSEGYVIHLIFAWCYLASLLSALTWEIVTVGDRYMFYVVHENLFGDFCVEVLLTICTARNRSNFDTSINVLVPSELCSYPFLVRAVVGWIASLVVFTLIFLFSFQNACNNIDFSNLSTYQNYGNLGKALFNLLHLKIKF